MPAKLLKQPESWIIINTVVILASVLLMQNIRRVDKVFTAIYSVISAVLGYFFIRTIRIGSKGARNFLSWFFAIFIAIIPLILMVLGLLNMLLQDDE
jgi:phosphatidylserine synthase